MSHIKTLITTVSSIVLFLALHASPIGVVIDANWLLFLTIGAVGVMFAGSLVEGRF